MSRPKGTKNNPNSPMLRNARARIAFYEVFRSLRPGTWPIHTLWKVRGPDDVVVWAGQSQARVIRHIENGRAFRAWVEIPKDILE